MPPSLMAGRFLAAACVPAAVVAAPAAGEPPPAAVVAFEVSFLSLPPPQAATKAAPSAPAPARKRRRAHGRRVQLLYSLISSSPIECGVPSSISPSALPCPSRHLLPRSAQ